MDVNYLLVLVSAVMAMVVGFLWYGPLFGKKWMKLMGQDTISPEEKQAMQKRVGALYVIQFIILLGEIYAFAYLFNCWERTNGVKLGIFIWAGFILPIIAGSCIWTRDSGKTAWEKFLIQALYQLVIFILVGIILNVWQ